MPLAVDSSVQRLLMPPSTTASSSVAAAAASSASSTSSIAGSCASVASAGATRIRSASTPTTASFAPALPLTKGSPRLLPQLLRPPKVDFMTTINQLLTLERLLWHEQTPMDSNSLEYIHFHAQLAIERAQLEAPHAHFAQKKQIHDVRVYHQPRQRRRQTTGSFFTASSASSPLSASSSFASSRYDYDKQLQWFTNCDFRGSTRVFGTIEELLELLCTSGDATFEWVSRNTQKGFLEGKVLSSQSLVENNCFYVWNQKYFATKLAKTAAFCIENCFSEYAIYPFGDSFDQSHGTNATTDQEDNQPRRRAFVYRRCINPRAFREEIDAIDQKLFVDGALVEKVPFYLQDWLYELVETSDPNVCKLVLTAQAVLPQTQLKSSTWYESAFEEFCTYDLLSIRGISLQYASEQRQISLVPDTNTVGASARSGIISHGAGGLHRDHAVTRSGYTDRDHRAAEYPAKNSTRSYGGGGGPQYRFGFGPVRTVTDWILQQETQHHCSICGKSFGLLRKRHCCFFCQHAVCAKCSQEKPMPREILLLTTSPTTCGLIKPKQRLRQCVYCLRHSEPCRALHRALQNFSWTAWNAAGSDSTRRPSGGSAAQDEHNSFCQPWQCPPQLYEHIKTRRCRPPRRPRAQQKATRGVDKAMSCCEESPTTSSCSDEEEEYARALLERKKPPGIILYNANDLA